MQALARVADALGEQGLDVHVDILVVHGELHLICLNVLQDGLQAFHDGLYFVLLDDALLAQHLRVGDRAGDVLLVEPGIELDGGVKIIDKSVGLFLEPTSPEFHTILSFDMRRANDLRPFASQNFRRGGNKF